MGDRVSALYPNGNRYKATVAEVLEEGVGGYIVDWDDGDQSSRHRTAAHLLPLASEVSLPPPAPDTVLLHCVYFCVCVYCVSQSLSSQALSPVCTPGVVLYITRSGVI